MSKREESVSEIGKRTANLTTYLLFGKIASFLLLVTGFIVVVRILGPKIYGIYVLALAVQGIFGSVGIFGVDNAFNKFIAENKFANKKAINDILSSGFIIVLVAGIILTVIAFGLSGFLANSIYHNSGLVLPFEIISLSILFSMLSGAVYAALIGYGQGANASICVIVQATLQAGIGISLAILGFGSLAPITGFVVGLLGGFITGIVILRFKNDFKMSIPSIKKITKIFNFSLPLAISTVLVAIIGDIGVLLLGLYVATSVIGNIGIALSVNTLFDLVIGAIGLSLIQTFSSTLKSKKARNKIGNFYNGAIYYGLIFLTPVVLFVTILAKPFSYTAFGGTYALAPLYIRFLSIGIFLGLAGIYASYLMVSMGKTKLILKYNLIIFAVQLILLAILIPYIKDIGFALIIFIIAPLLTDIFYIRAVIKTMDVHIDLNKISRIVLGNLIAALPLFILLLLLGKNYILLLVLGIIAMVAIYPLSLSAVKGIEEKDVKLIKKFFSGMPVVGYILNKLLDYSSLLITYD